MLTSSSQALDQVRIGDCMRPTLLDEPTAYLDQETAAEIVVILRRVAAGRTVLLVAHGHSLAPLADQTAVLADGRVTSSPSHQWAGSSVGVAT